MILKAAKRSLRVGEVPIEYRPRIGESKLNTVRDGWRHLRFMLVHSSTFLFLIPGLSSSSSGSRSCFRSPRGPVTLFGLTWYIHAMIAGSTATLVGAQIVQLGLFARTYALLYLGDSDPLLERCWKRLRLEHGLLAGGALFLAGAAVLGWIFVDWWSSGFGVLAREHQALFGLTLSDSVCRSCSRRSSSACSAFAAEILWRPPSGPPRPDSLLRRHLRPSLFGVASQPPGADVAADAARHRAANLARLDPPAALNLTTGSRNPPKPS